MRKRLQLIACWLLGASLLTRSCGDPLENFIPLQTVTVQDPVSSAAITDVALPGIGLFESELLSNVIRPSVTPSPSMSPTPSPTPTNSPTPSTSITATPTSTPSPSVSPSPTREQPSSAGESTDSSQGNGSTNPSSTSPPSESGGTTATTTAPTTSQTSDTSTTTASSTSTSTTSTTSTTATTDTTSTTSTTATTDTTTTTATTITSTTTTSTCPSGCQCEDPGELLGDPSFDETELQNFGTSASSIFSAADWTVGFSRSTWKKDLATHDGTQLSLTVEKQTDGLYGAEIRTNVNHYGYGCVSACMKPIGISGIISSLFTYTGPYDGIGGSTPKQNEIDIEFEGQNTNRVQFNYYTENDAGGASQGNEHDHVLSFNPADSFNVYGFRWTPWGIEWEVNGDVVYDVKSMDAKPPPTVSDLTVQKVMANVWVVKPATEPFFGGPFDDASFTSASAQYKWIRYEKLDSNGCCTISASC